MQRTHRRVATVVRGVRWGLPWIGALALSVGIASAMTLAVTGATVPEPAGSTANISIPPNACDTSGGRLLYVGQNSWIPAEPTVASCANAGG